MYTLQNLITKIRFSAIIHDRLREAHDDFKPSYRSVALYGLPFKQEIRFLALIRKEVRQQAKTRMTGKSGHRRVPAEFYENFPFPMLSLEKQNRGVAKVERLEQEIEELKSSIYDADILRGSIIKKYLR